MRSNKLVTRTIFVSNVKAMIVDTSRGEVFSGVIEMLGDYSEMDKEKIVKKLDKKYGEHVPVTIDTDGTIVTGRVVSVSDVTLDSYLGVMTEEFFVANCERREARDAQE